LEIILQINCTAKDVYGYGVSFRHAYMQTSTPAWTHARAHPRMHGRTVARTLMKDEMKLWTNLSCH